MKKNLLALAMWSNLFLALPASAADQTLYWNCGSGSWDDLCWNLTPGSLLGNVGQPQTDDTARLEQNDAVNRTVQYANTLYPGAVLTYLRIDATGTGSLTLSQTQDALAAKNAAVGYTGTGRIVQSGGTHTLSDSLMLGYDTYSQGSYELTGGSVTAAREWIGYWGTGSFTHSGGTHDIGAAGGLLILGYNSGSSGGYALSGSGNLVAASEFIGSYGSGNFNHSAGTHTVGTSLAIGYNAGGSGSYRLSGTGSLDAAVVVVGHSGTGDFIQDGGAHAVGELAIGDGNNGNYGNGKYLLNGGSLAAGNEGIGLAGTGEFVQSGGTHTVAASLVLGANVGGNGSYNLSNGNLAVVNEVIGHRGSGSFTQSGGDHSVSGDMILANLAGSDGTYTLAGGKLRAANINVGAGGAFNFNGGILAVDRFNGSLTNNGGTLAPGASPGATEITGDYTQAAAGLYAVEIGGLLAGTEYDVLHVAGSATLDGTLNVSLFDLGSGLFAPHAGDSFDILTAEQLIGSFGTLSFAALLDPNLTWHIDYLADAFGSTDVVRLSVQAVPVPAAAWLFASGLLGLVGIARRKSL